jgi:hypothetical protein
VLHNASSTVIQAVPVTVSSAQSGSRLIEVAWDGKMLMVFADDLQSRCERIAN